MSAMKFSPCRRSSSNHQTKTRMNIKLLKTVRDAILANPRQFRMETFFSFYDSAGNPAPKCGTAACIAGWAIAIHDGTKLSVAADDAWNEHDNAKKHLGLTQKQADILFYYEEWPHPFWERYEAAENVRAAAKAAADRIDLFIKTKGKE